MNEEILFILEKELNIYKEKFDEILERYSDFKELNISPLEKDDFTYNHADRKLLFVEELRRFYHQKEISYETSLWFINQWGGIGSFRDNDTNKERIKRFWSGLTNKKLTKDLFSVISSLSKISAFHDHNEYFIYDSRVVYTLNWFILKNKLQNPQFFPMPAGRNASLVLFDLNTIINLYYKDKLTLLNGKWKDDLFLDTKHAYFVYCDLIKELSHRLMPTKKPYYLEMILFTMAEPEIFNDLKDKVNISI